METLTKADATKLAKDLATRLGQNWEGTVNKNIDWHYGARLKTEEPNVTGEMEANHCATGVTYVVYLRTVFLEVIKSGADPVKVLQEANKQLKLDADVFVNSFNLLSELTS